MLHFTVFSPPIDASGGDSKHLGCGGHRYPFYHFVIIVVVFFVDHKQFYDMSHNRVNPGLKIGCAPDSPARRANGGDPETPGQGKRAASPGEVPAPPGKPRVFAPIPGLPPSHRGRVEKTAHIRCEFGSGYDFRVSGIDGSGFCSRHVLVACARFLV